MNESTNPRIDEFWYDRGQVDNPKFWKRFGCRPPIAGASILDFGCGRGRLVVDMAMAGASRVVGVDLDPESIAFVRRNLAEEHPELAEKIVFHEGTLDVFPDNSFDFAVSKDTFEHVADLGGALRQIRRCLKPGGRLYAGFGPLYRFCNGDHGETGIRFPWGHIIMPESWIVARMNRVHKYKASLLCELISLNRLSLANYRRLLHESGMEIVMFRVNQSGHWAAGFFRFLRRFPCLEEYCTFNIYAIMKKFGAG